MMTYTCSPCTKKQRQEDCGFQAGISYSKTLSQNNHLQAHGPASPQPPSSLSDLRETLLAGIVLFLWLNLVWNQNVHTLG